MSDTYFLAGHESLANRGCEALVRGISTIVREARPDATFYAPSFVPDADRRQWPDAAANGVEFVDAYRLQGADRGWVRVQARLPALRRVWFPRAHPPAALWERVRQASACIMTGGDVLSLDYGMASLAKYMGQAEAYMAIGRPAVLWAGSVGPFTRAPDLERRVVAHLSRYARLTVRESATATYLSGLGLKEVTPVADPAFAMQPEAFDSDPVLPADRPDGVLGFNVSPLIRLLLESRSPGSARDMEASVCEFLTDVVTRTRLGILLLPHVDATDGGSNNSDFVYLQTLAKRANLPAGRLTLAPRTLNAAQLKHLVGQCRYFMGARTHATIGAWSSGVPTCSLGYSIKARGLNRDLFGDERYVLDTAKITRVTLWKQLEQLQQDESSVRADLARLMPEWRQRARLAADMLR